MTRAMRGDDVCVCVTRVTRGVTERHLHRQPATIATPAATARASVRAPASAARVKGERWKRMTRAMMPRAPHTVTSGIRARHRARHQSAMSPLPPPPPPRLACAALRAPGGIARGRCRAARATAASSISGDPEGESNPQRRRCIRNGHQARAKKRSHAPAQPGGDGLLFAQPLRGARYLLADHSVRVLARDPNMPRARAPNRS